MTNFWLSHPGMGNYPCPRYNKVTEMMQNKKAISVADFASILKTVSEYRRTEDGQESGTIYSNVYDLANGDVYIYHKHRFSQDPFGITYFRGTGGQTALKRGFHGTRRQLCVIENDAYNLS
jgi:hypothetical protein